MGERHCSWTPLTIAVSALLAGACQPRSEQEQNDSVGEVAQSPALPVAEPPMDREALLTAVASVASAAALGEKDGEAQGRLEGKRFRVRIRFGCVAEAPPPDGQSPFRIRFDEEGRILRIRAAPDLTVKDAGVADLAGPSVEAVEGFWMHRPWLLADGCPVLPPIRPSDAPTAVGPSGTTESRHDETPEPTRRTGHRVGLAQFFTEGDPRTARRDERPYEATSVLAENVLLSRLGYNLVLEGRLRERPGGPVISCQVTSPDLPLECVVSAEFSRVAIERADTNAVLAEWSR